MYQSCVFSFALDFAQIRSTAGGTRQSTGPGSSGLAEPGQAQPMGRLGRAVCLLEPCSLGASLAQLPLYVSNIMVSFFTLLHRKLEFKTVCDMIVFCVCREGMPP